MRTTIRIRRVEKPLDKNLERDLNWICRSFGFCGPGKQKSIAGDIFKEIVRESQDGHGITSTEIARDIEMSRGAVINHLNNLLETGLIAKRGTRYELRSANLSRTIREIQRDMLRVFEDLEDMADEIDEQLGFKKRE